MCNYKAVISLTQFCNDLKIECALPWNSHFRPLGKPNTIALDLTPKILIIFSEDHQWEQRFFVIDTSLFIRKDTFR